jgi:hypothetical protein
LALIALARGWISLYWLLRCTVPQLSIAGRKVLVPFIAFYLIFLDASIAVVLLFVNGWTLQFPHLYIAELYLGRRAVINCDYSNLASTQRTIDRTRDQLLIDIKIERVVIGDNSHIVRLAFPGVDS